MDRLLREGIPEEDRIPSEVAEIEIQIILQPCGLRLAGNPMVHTSRSPVLTCLFSVSTVIAMLSWDLGVTFSGLVPRSLFSSSSSRHVDVAMMRAAQDGIFTPLVDGAKVIMGEAQLKKLRSELIKAHGEVMTKFIDTASTAFGQRALRMLFDVADKDRSAYLDDQELKAALKVLGFQWMEDDRVANVMQKGDTDGDGLIDFDEFSQVAPGVLRQNLMKLAKSNGSEMGLLS